jgi:hypothetical protein
MKISNTMRKFKLINLLLIVATSLLLVNCTTDPLPGAAGNDGIDGVDGSDGVDGASGTTECAACHNVATSEAVHASYLFSGHAAGGAVGYAGSRASCAQCHSNEGYVDYVTLGATNEEGYANPTAISCKTCHDTHTTFDFENDGFDYALRSIRPVDLITDPSYTINYNGTSNNCALCHQPRTSPPEADGSGDFAVTSSHWGPHHGPQSTFLEGIQGAELVGTNEYPAPASATHRTGSSCTSCHMGLTSGETDGNHTWIPTSTACAQCHTNGIPDGVAGLEDDMSALGLLLEDIGIVHDGHPVEGTYSITEAEAAWNYLLVMEDASKGTHNPAYARALIKNSIEVLSAN